jgi:hypothetical protein
VFERKRLTASFGATIALLTMSLAASASVPLELAVHGAARAARQQKIDRVLVVVRESSRSGKDAEIDGVLRAVEKMAIDMLKKESSVEGIVDKNVRAAAGRSKARIDMRPSEVRRFTTATDTDAGTLLSLDYKNRGGVSLQVTLLDSTKVYFSETVQLDKRPDPIPEYLKDKKGDETPAKDEKPDSDKAANKDGSTKEVKLAPGSRLNS